MHVAITGASSGIGEALVRAYLRAGAKVTMVARRKEQMETIAREEKGESLILARDLSKVETACDWLQEAEDHFGPIDILCNNAGVQIVAPLQHCDLAKGQQLLDLDLVSPIRLMHTILPKMLERNSGTIVNIASMASLAPTPGMVYYSAAKSGFAAASECLRMELRKTGVRVLTVYPGPVDTAMARAAYDSYQGQAPRVMKWLTEGTTEQLAERIQSAVKRGKARIIYPRFYTLSRHMPGLTFWVLYHFAPLPPPPAS